jgi:hypothetical protein
MVLVFHELLEHKVNIDSTSPRGACAIEKLGLCSLERNGRMDTIYA